jgi:hypothetical protein
MKNLLLIIALVPLLAFADVKISELTLMSTADVEAADSFPIVDSSASTTKRVRLADIFSVPALSNALAAKQASLPWTTNGDMVYYSSGSARLPIGSAGQYLSVVGGVPAWVTLTGSGITTLNLQTDAVQTFAVGTTGTDFAVSSSGGVHTFNLPTASATNRGALSTSDWSTFNAKESALTFSAPIIRTVNAISCQAASGSQAGCLSSTDWTTFNSKQAAGNYITALTGDVTASGPGSVAATIANSAVTNAKLADVATATFKGRTTGGTGAVEDLTATQATALLNAMVGDSGSGGTKGLVPAPAIGDSTKYLKGDGTWGTVSAGGVTVGNSITSGTANRVLYENASNQVAESANLTYDGTTFASPTISATTSVTTPLAIFDATWGRIYMSGTNFVFLRNGNSSLTIGDGAVILGTGTALYANTDALGDIGGSSNRFRDSYFSRYSRIGTSEIIGTTSATPNYELDVRGGAGNSTIQLSNTASSSTSSDGAIIDFDGGDLYIKNQEAAAGSDVIIHASNSLAASFQYSGGAGKLNLGATTISTISNGDNYNTPVLFTTGDISPFNASTYYLGAYRFTANVAPYPFLAAYIGSEGVMIGATSALSAGTKPNVELDVRGAAGNSTIQLSNTATGATSSDGALVDFGSNILTLNNQEEATTIKIGASSIKFSGSGATDAVTITANLTPNVSAATGSHLALMANGADEVARMYSSGGIQAVQVREDLTNQETGGGGNIGIFGGIGPTSGPTILPFKYGYIGEKFMIGATSGSGSGVVPNYELELRGVAGNATIQLNNTTSGVASTDGTIFDYDGTHLEIKNQESAGRIRLTPGSTQGVDVHTSGAKATCDSTTRGQLFLEEGGAGVADILYMCMKAAADTYAWETVKAAP